MRFRQLKTAGEKLFSPNELYAVTQTRTSVAMERVANGRTDIEDLIVDQQQDWKPWHDVMIVWNEYTFATCREMGGMDYLEDCLKEGYDSGFGFLYKRTGSPSFSIPVAVEGGCCERKLTRTCSTIEPSLLQ
jgi:hypothetical protein